MKDDTTKGLACIGVGFLGIFGIVVGTLFNGWSLTMLWNWFIVPLFDLPAMSIVYAIGISVLIGALSRPPEVDSSKKKETSDLIASVLTNALLRPLFSVFFGWIVTLFL